jgi:hypothetical protein
LAINHTAREIARRIRPYCAKDHRNPGYVRAFVAAKIAVPVRRASPRPPPLFAILFERKKIPCVWFRGNSSR